MRKPAAWLPAVPAAVAVVALAGCGSGPTSNGVVDHTPSAILLAAVDALKSAHSVHIKGTVGSGAQQGTIDADAFSNGDLDGTVGQSGETAQIVKVGGTDYIKGPLSFWKTAGGTTSGIAVLLAGRWISIPDADGSASGVAGIGNTFTMSSLAAGLTQDNGTITKGSTGTVDGQPAISITSSNGGTLWIATTGTPYILEATASGSGTNSGKLTFSDWNQSTVPTPPAGAISAASIAGGSGGTTTTIPGGTGVTGLTGLTGNTGDPTSST